MSEEQMIVDILRGFTKALIDRDTNRSLSFLTEDAVWLTPNGNFKNIDGIKKYIEWMNTTIEDQQIMDNDRIILVRPNKAVYECILSGISKGRKWETPSISIYDLRDDKISSIRTVYDRLNLAHQVTTGIAKTAVGNIVREMEKGLH